ncbi:hypothetical protein ACH50O_03720 [Methylomonas sp. 2BW1-5-20]|uniref:hypothetical protein n=1 Tax=Methylomonas sp. 2BW1-5-20 TaxID=3376686 RepID=UPI004050B6EC
MMNITDLRNGKRRLKPNRRVADRRVADFPFGSTEWEENIKTHYLVWPKHERRQADRRGCDRRETDRRQQQLSEQHRSNQKYSHILLTQEERKLIEDLYFYDFE